jgi:uncharacterized membrane protein
MDSEMIVVTFDNPDQAERVLTILKQLERKDYLRMIDAVALGRQLDGHGSTTEIGGMNRQTESILDGMAAAVRSFMSSPSPYAEQAPNKPVADDGAATLFGSAFPRASLQAIRQALRLGSSAVAILVAPEWVERAMELLTGFEGQVFHANPAGGMARGAANKSAEYD